MVTYEQFKNCQALLTQTVEKAKKEIHTLDQSERDMIREDICEMVVTLGELTKVIREE